MVFFFATYERTMPSKQFITTFLEVINVSNHAGLKFYKYIFAHQVLIPANKRVTGSLYTCENYDRVNGKYRPCGMAKLHVLSLWFIKCKDGTYFLLLRALLVVYFNRR